MSDRSGQPCVSVLTAVHNGERHLRVALDGILAQTFGDFELIVVDDGSTDATASILCQYAEDDERVLMLRNERNIGLTRSLNRGLAWARGEFVARHDSDDLSEPVRFERQARFLREHPDVGLCGSAYYVIDGDGTRVDLHRQPADDTAIRWQMLFRNAFCHTSVMLRRQLVLDATGGYDESCRYSQDYELWARLLRVTRAANIDEPLVSYRVHEASISTACSREQSRSGASISAREIAAVAPDLAVTEAQAALLREWYYAFPKQLEGRDIDLARRLLRLVDVFERQPGLDAGRAASVAMTWRTRIRAALAVPECEPVA